MSVSLAALAQYPLINEVLPADQRTVTDPYGHHPDVIELYNRASVSVNLIGSVIVLGATSQRIMAPLVIPPHGFLVLYCDHHPERGADHLDLKLPRNGGTLLLIDPDHVTVRDVFTWPTLPADVSMGRIRDGAKDWGFFPSPTLGTSNNDALAVHRLLKQPAISVRDGTISCSTEDDATIRYTMDGSTPTTGSAEYTAPVEAAEAHVFNACAFAHDALPSHVTTRTIIDGNDALGISLSMDPADLWDELTGILAKGERANFSRSGAAWQRRAQVEWMKGGKDNVRSVGIAIAGSGSRSAAKKNFKLSAADRFGSEGPISVPAIGSYSEVLLRADASPNALLRNLFMDAIAQRTGAHVDAQPSIVLPLYLNGAYWGTYRAMPAKNAEWLKELSGAEAVDMIDGPGAHALKGDDLHYKRAIDALLRGAPMDSLALSIDLNSLIDLACFDLYTGRADHDLNVRCWRPKTHEGKLRWLLFDMDLWAPPDDNSLERFCSASATETPYVPQLMANTALRDRLLARMSALLATALAPDRATSLADSLYATNASLMQSDRERWAAEMTIPDPRTCIGELREHISIRPAHVLDQLARRARLQQMSVDVRVEPAGAGSVAVEDLPLTSDQRVINAFGNVPLHVVAKAEAGMEFVGWKGVDDRSSSITIDPAKTRTLRAMFRPADPSSQHGLEQRGE